MTGKGKDDRSSYKGTNEFGDIFAYWIPATSSQRGVSLNKYIIRDLFSKGWDCTKMGQYGEVFVYWPPANSSASQRNVDGLLARHGG